MKIKRPQIALAAALVAVAAVAIALNSIRSATDPDAASTAGVYPEGSVVCTRHLTPACASDAVRRSRRAIAVMDATNGIAFVSLAVVARGEERQAITELRWGDAYVTLHSPANLNPAHRDSERRTVRASRASGHLTYSEANDGPEARVEWSDGSEVFALEVNFAEGTRRETERRAKEAFERVRILRP